MNHQENGWSNQILLTNCQTTIISWFLEQIYYKLELFSYITIDFFCLTWIYKFFYYLFFLIWLHNLVFPLGKNSFKTRIDPLKCITTCSHVCWYKKFTEMFWLNKKKIINRFKLKLNFLIKSEVAIRKKAKTNKWKFALHFIFHTCCSLITEILIWSKTTKLILLDSLLQEIENDSIWIEIYFWFSDFAMFV